MTGRLRVAAAPSVSIWGRKISPSAMAALLVAAAVGLLPLARPGAVAVGVGALALLPLGALLLAGAARAAAITAVLAYVAALVWAYTNHYAPLYAYLGQVDAHPEATETLVVVALAALPAAWLPLEARRLSAILLWFLYLQAYVSMMVVPLFIEGDLSTVLPFDVALAGCMAILALITRLPAASIRAPSLSLDTLTHLLVVLGLLSSAYIVAAFGIHAPPNLADVYTTRLQSNTVFEAAFAISYVVPWAGNAINPMLMALGMARRRVDLVVLGLAGQVLIYSVTGYKNVFFSIAIVPLVYLTISIARRSFGLLVPAAGAAIVVGSALAGELALALARRVFATPGQVGWYYFEYFSDHPAYHLSHSFLRWLGPSTYNIPPPEVIGSVYFPGRGTNANANIWADAFANFGFAGIIGFTLVLGLVLWVTDALGHGRDLRIAGPLLAIAGLTLSDSALFTTILTNGLALSCVLIALMPPGSVQAPSRSPPPIPRDSPYA
jgi:O-antigen polymerase